MKLHSYPETDSLYIELKARPCVETREIAEGLVADLHAAGTVIDFDVDGVSRRWNPGRSETLAMPAGWRRDAEKDNAVYLTSKMRQVSFRIYFYFFV